MPQHADVETPASSGSDADTPASSGSDTDTRIDATGRWVLLVTIVGSALVIIDVTAMNVIVPSIQEDLRTSVAGIQWVVEAYTLFLASVTLVGGSLADRFGRRKVYGIGLVLFTLASLACGLAPNASALIVARGAQGLGGALLLPGGLALIGARFPRATRGRAIGIWASMSGLMAVAGPVLGGILSDVGSWRWIFFVNVPLGLALLFPLATKVPESVRQRVHGPLDILGAFLATLGLAGITYGLIQAGIVGWGHITVIAGLGIGASSLAAFVLQERRAADPMLPLGLFRARDFTGANVLTLFLYAALAASMFFVPMRLIFLDGFRPAQAGLAMVPTIVLISLLSPRAGALTDSVGARSLLTLGATVTALGLLAIGWAPPGTPYWQWTLGGLVLVGLGMAAVVAPLSTTVIGAAPESEVGTASGVNNAVSRLGALLAIAVAGLVALGTFGHWLEADLDALGLDARDRDAAWAERTDLAAADPPPGLNPDVAADVEAAYDRAFAAAYRAVQWTMAASATIAAAVALLLLTPRRDDQGVAAAPSDDRVR